MGKAKITFDLETEIPELNDALNGWKYKMVLWELDQELRSKTKYGDENIPVYQEIRDFLREQLIENNIDIHE